MYENADCFAEKPLLSEECVVLAVQKLVQLSFEKIDRVRMTAARCIQAILQHQPQVPSVPHRAELEAIYNPLKYVEYASCNLHHTEKATAGSTLR